VKIIRVVAMSPGTAPLATARGANAGLASNAASACLMARQVPFACGVKAETVAVVTLTGTNLGAILTIQ
jgi:hypothetical protein